MDLTKLPALITGSGTASSTSNLPNSPYAAESSTSNTTPTSTTSGSTNTMAWIIAGIAYAGIGQFLQTKTLVGFSVLLVLGALLVNTKSGHSVFTDIGL